MNNQELIEAAKAAIPTAHVAWSRINPKAVFGSRNPAKPFARGEAHVILDDPDHPYRRTTVYIELEVDEINKVCCTAVLTCVVASATLIARDLHITVDVPAAMTDAAWAAVEPLTRHTIAGRR